MGKYDHLFKIYAETSEKLTPVEALFAITLIVVYADGKMSEKEQDLLKQVLASGSLKDYSSQDFQKTSEKIDKIWDNRGTAALFNAAVAALPQDQVKGAFSIAAAFAIADGKVTKEECQYLHELSSALGLSDESAKTIIQQEWANYSKTD